VYVAAVFFVPMYLSTNINVAFLSYAITHGIQYELMVALLAWQERTDTSPGTHWWFRWPLVTYGGLLVAGGLLNTHTETLSHLQFVATSPLFTALKDGVLGLLLGFTMAHFVIDAGMWRLRQTLARAYLTHRLAWLLPPYQTEPATVPR
jgi:hypothetical protein